MRIGRISKLLYPGYGCCGRCQTVWALVKGHSTDYKPGLGCFPLCEKCWKALVPETRLPYYRQLWEEWKRWGEQDESEWQAIEAAVLAGG